MQELKSKNSTREYPAEITEMVDKMRVIAHQAIAVARTTKHWDDIRHVLIDDGDVYVVMEDMVYGWENLPPASGVYGSVSRVGCGDGWTAEFYDGETGSPVATGIPVEM